MEKLVRTSAKLLYVSIFGVCLLLLTAGQTVGASDNDLLARWKFDETSQGAVAQDSSGNGNHATPTGTDGGPKPSTNTPNVSYNNPRTAHFTDEDQYYTTGPRESISFDEEMTIAAWINPADNESRQIMRAKPELEDTGIEFGTTQIETLVDPECNEEESVCDKVYSTVLYCNAYIGEQWEGLLSETTIPSGAWTHVACSFDGSMFKIYINGAVAESANAAGAFTPTPMEVFIGRHYTGVDPYLGLMDDLQIYGKALGAVAINNIYTQGVAQLQVNEPKESPINKANADPTLADTGTARLPVMILASAAIIILTIVLANNRLHDKSKTIAGH